MCPSEHPHGLGELRVTGHFSVVLPVGAHQVSEHLGVSRIRLCPRDHVAVPVPGCGHRVDREDVVPGLHEPSDKQAPISLDPDDHIRRIIDVLGEHRAPPLPRFSLSLGGARGALRG